MNAALPETPISGLLMSIKNESTVTAESPRGNSAREFAKQIGTTPIARKDIPAKHLGEKGQRCSRGDYRTTRRQQIHRLAGKVSRN